MNEQIIQTIAAASEYAYDTDSRTVIGWHTDRSEWTWADYEDTTAQSQMVWMTRVDGAGLVAYSDVEHYLADIEMSEQVSF